MKYDYIECGDCLELMKKIPDKSIDMILCDLPYGTIDCKWDKVIPFEPLWKQYNRVIKDNGAIVLFASQPFTTMLIGSNMKGYKHSWVWSKKNAGNILAAKYQPLKTTEDIVVFSKNGKKVNYYPIMESGYKDRSKEKPTKKRSELFNGIKSGEFKKGTNKKPDERYPKHLIEFSNASRKDHFHPTQKPVDLLEYLIKTYTNEGEIVLDNCMGSGSTCVACVNTNRHYIGFEKEPKYFDIACERLEKEKEKFKYKEYGEVEEDEKED